MFAVFLVGLLGLFLKQWAYRTDSATQNIQITITVAGVDGQVQSSEIWSLETTLISGALAFPDVKGKKTKLLGEAIYLRQGQGAILATYGSPGKTRGGPEEMLRAMQVAFPGGPRKLTQPRELNDWAEHVGSFDDPVMVPQRAWPKLYWLENFDDPTSIRELGSTLANGRTGAVKLISVEFLSTSASPEVGDLERELPFFNNYQFENRRFGEKAEGPYELRPLASRLFLKDFIWGIKK